MSRIPLYPLRFEPIYQYRLWGGRRLAELLAAPLPGDDPIGEAWLLSDREDHASQVADGPLQGATIRPVARAVAGTNVGKIGRPFPTVSAPAQVPRRAATSSRSRCIPQMGERICCRRARAEKPKHGSCSRRALKAASTRDCSRERLPSVLRRALAERTVADHLASFAPRPGDAVFIKAGTVHSLANVVVFEVQQNSDVTFRLYDWDRVDAKTGQPRALHVHQALACIDFSQGAIGPTAPVVESAMPVRRERLFDCEHFRLWRLRGETPFTVGVAGMPRVLVCIDGAGQLRARRRHTGRS